MDKDYNVHVNISPADLKTLESLEKTLQSLQKLSTVDVKLNTSVDALEKLEKKFSQISKRISSTLSISEKLGLTDLLHYHGLRVPFYKIA